MIFGTLLLMENAKNKRLPNPRKPLAHDNRMLAERAFYCILTFQKSDRRGSNPRPPPWQGGVLPTVLLSHFSSRRCISATKVIITQFLLLGKLFRKKFQIYFGRKQNRKILEKYAPFFIHDNRMLAERAFYCIFSSVAFPKTSSSVPQRKSQTICSSV